MAANTLTTILHKILARGLSVLRETCMLPQLVNGDYSADAAKPGTTIDVPVAADLTAYNVTPSNVDKDADGVTTGLVQISLDKWKGADFKLTDKERKEIDAREHFLPLETMSAVRAIANAINTSILDEYKGVYGFVGTAGTAPFSNSTDRTATMDATNVVAKLDEQMAPMNERSAVVNFTAKANMLALPQFSHASKRGNNIVVGQGILSDQYGIDWYPEHGIQTHTAGTITTGLIAKASTVQAVGDKTIVCTTAASTGACALVVGDIITFAGQTQTYVVTAAATQASAATDVTVNIEPGLKVALAGSEAVAVKASHVVNLAFQREAFALAMRTPDTDMELGNSLAQMTDPKTGLTLRLEVKRQYKQVKWELDALWGTKLVRPEYAVRLAG